MARFVVTVKEVWKQEMQVEASSKEEAIGKIKNGEGELVDQSFEYSSTMDESLWEVEEE